MCSDPNFDVLETLGEDCECLNECSKHCFASLLPSLPLALVFGDGGNPFTVEHLTISLQWDCDEGSSYAPHFRLEEPISPIADLDTSDHYPPAAGVKELAARCGDRYHIVPCVPVCFEGHQAGVLVREEVQSRCCVSWPRCNEWGEWHRQSKEDLVRNAGLHADDAEFVMRSLKIAAYRADTEVLAALTDTIRHLETLETLSRQAKAQTESAVDLSASQVLPWQHAHAELVWSPLTVLETEQDEWAPVLKVFDEIVNRKWTSLARYADSRHAKIAWELVEKLSSEL